MDFDIRYNFEHEFIQFLGLELRAELWTWTWILTGVLTKLGPTPET